MEKIKWLSSLPPKYTQKIINDIKINNTKLHSNGSYKAIVSLGAVKKKSTHNSVTDLRKVQRTAEELGYDRNLLNCKFQIFVI